MKQNTIPSLFIIFFFNKHILFKLVKDIETPAKDNLYSLSITLNSEIEAALNEFPNPVIYIAVSGVADKNKIYWTSTVSSQL